MHAGRKAGEAGAAAAGGTLLACQHVHGRDGRGDLRRPQERAGHCSWHSPGPGPWQQRHGGSPVTGISSGCDSQTD